MSLGDPGAEARGMGIEVWWSLITGHMEAIANLENSMRWGVAHNRLPKTPSEIYMAALAGGDAVKQTLSAVDNNDHMFSPKTENAFENWTVEMNDIDLGPRIGFGSQGTCHEGFWGGTKVKEKSALITALPFLSENL